MKITKSAEDKFKIELNRFELKTLFTMARKIGGTGKARQVFSNSMDSLCVNAAKYFTGDTGIEAPDFKSYLDHTFKEELFGGVCYLADDFKLSFPLEKKNKNIPKRDKKGHFVSDKKYIKFWYPKEEFKHYGEELEGLFNAGHRFVFEQKTVLNPQFGDNILTGKDCGTGKNVTYDLGLVFGRKYSNTR